MLVFDSKCLGCVYVQRESKSSDFKGVSGTVIVSVYTLHYYLMHGEDLQASYSLSVYLFSLVVLD
jgi:hypothetical protein